MNIELSILDWIQTLHTPFLDKIMVFITRLGDAGIIWIVLSIVLLLIPKTRKSGAVILDIALPGADDTQKDEEGRLFVPAFPGMLCHCHKCMPEKSGCKDKTLRCDRGTDFSGRNPERFFLSVRTYGSFVCFGNSFVPGR